ncbi:DnaJ domain-containing protein [Ottowia sp.]|uniref:DnaJ domain-containing protein n=1 Tax=Ottowia sp. TaxID=1898956 RepID=UPI002B89B226|nr:DnaJ domain-containing protein [Ottowia sp.]HOB65281.1 DnaJ domain-containing protein [Ottowia sp.]
MHTYYDVLEVLPTASPEVIRGAYRHLAQRWHPDRNAGRLDEARQRMSAINEAYRVVGDETVRAAYDQWLKDQTESRGSTPPEPVKRARESRFVDPFEEVAEIVKAFGAGVASAFQPRSQAERDLYTRRYTIPNWVTYPLLGFLLAVLLVAVLAGAMR